MGLGHSPRKNDANKSNTRPLITLETILDAIESMDQRLNQRLINVEEKTSLIYERVNELERREEKLQEEMDALKSSVQNCELNAKELSDRAQRKNNLIVKNVPESEEGEEILKELLQIIIPEAANNIVSDRVGPLKPSQNFPRNVRLFMMNPKYKSTALENCKLLKGNPRFQSISVCKKDMTKLEQQQHKLEPKITRSTARRNAKRPVDEQMEYEHPEVASKKPCNSTETD